MKAEKKAGAKEEATIALQKAMAALAGPVSAVEWSVVGGLVFYALKQVALVEEVKRKRAVKGPMVARVPASGAA